MKNGYFQLVSLPSGGCGIKFFPPEGEGEPVRVGEAAEWLDRQVITYEQPVLKQFEDS